ncbi:MAG: SpoIID/LytB domain-containing protein [Bacteroidales bacterium]
MQPKISVGILYSEALEFNLNGRYRHLETGIEFEGPGKALLENGKLIFYIGNSRVDCGFPIELEPVSYQKANFDLRSVTIGIDFHWERKEDQRFRGELKIIEEDGLLVAINILYLEDYLISVISSEMSASSSAELLRAHAVISRSWLLAQKEKEKRIKGSGVYVTTVEKNGERIRWYDREDHTSFDVCADDHCQRYQGITRAGTSTAEAAVNSTLGKVLTYGGNICDARYSKCCGGISERFENIWEPEIHPYLTQVVDNPVDPEGYETVLDTEEKSAKWILGNPEAFCNTRSRYVLSQVLNDYDQETLDFFRWSVTYTQEEIKELLRNKADLEIGYIIDLLPVERGTSGRLVRLKIEGTSGSMIIGKELEIRKALSASHLYSSAFVVEKSIDDNGIPSSFTLKGAGWGHGAGLCQIGAAVMGAGGYSYNDILTHYFPGTVIEQRY